MSLCWTYVIYSVVWGVGRVWRGEVMGGDVQCTCTYIYSGLLRFTDTFYWGVQSMYSRLLRYTKKSMIGQVLVPPSHPHTHTHSGLLGRWWRWTSNIPRAHPHLQDPLQGRHCFHQGACLCCVTVSSRLQSHSHTNIVSFPYCISMGMK